MITKDLRNEDVSALCAAVLRQAINDYIDVLKHGDHGMITKRELEMFFESAMFDSMIGSAITPEKFKEKAKLLRLSTKSGRRLYQQRVKPNAEVLA